MRFHQEYESPGHSVAALRLTDPSGQAIQPCGACDPGWQARCDP
jgi:hypothetical protein